MEEVNQYTQEQLDSLNKALREVASLYYHAFSTPTGEKVLEHIDNMSSLSLLQPNDMMDANVSVSPSEFMMMREGHGQVVRHIKRMVEYYKENK